MAKRKPSYEDMDQEELEEALGDLALQKEEVRLQMLVVHGEIDRRATDERVRKAVGNISPEDRARVAEIIGEAGGIESEATGT